MTRAAALCSAFLGLGFGLPGAYGAWYFAREHEVWQFLGFPTYGSGPFERWGLPTTTALLVAYVVVCAVEVALAVPLWSGSTVALWASLAILPVELAFWTGFALPFGFVFGLARTVLVVMTLARA
jgi:hypothetical protein